MTHEVIAVYGTLRKGLGNHRHHLSGAEYIGTGDTADSTFSMLDCGFPFVLGGGQCKVRVEVYRVSEADMVHVDNLEGYPGWYDKKKVSVVLDSGQRIDANMYIMDDEKAHGMDVAAIGGVLDYADHRRLHRPY